VPVGFILRKFGLAGIIYGQKLKKFYIRSGKTSQELAIDETAAYVKERFGD
jgi:hypothetical protein